MPGTNYERSTGTPEQENPATKLTDDETGRVFFTKTFSYLDQFYWDEDDENWGETDQKICVDTVKKIDVNPEILKEEMRKDLKTISLMSTEEIEAELELYGVEIPEEYKDSRKKLEDLLNDARITIANEDKNSDIIDFHIGTYTQNKYSKYCTVLSQLDTMSDDEIRDMIQIKEDSDNKLSYYVTFPQDKWNDNAAVQVTEEELNSWSLTINENWEDRIVNNFPRGDKDVTLITMAFVKRFWTKIIDGWAWTYNTQNKFRLPTESKLKDNQYFEDIQDYSNLPQHSIVGFLNPDEMRRKGIDFRLQAEEEVSWIKNNLVKEEATSSLGWGAAIVELSNGKKVCITIAHIYISDWTLIPNIHAMSVRWYDEASEELIVSGSEYNNISEVRIPKELFIFMETASPEWTPGVDKTPEPTE